VSCRRALSAGFIALMCSSAAVALASVSQHRSEGRLQQQGIVAEAATDPLNELQRTVLAIKALVRRRVPDWSPEADAVKWRVDSILAGVVDYQQIGRSALGTDWDQLTNPQHGAFLRAFSALTNQAFVSGLTRSDVHLRFVSETVMGAKASVMVTADVSRSTEAAEQQIEYRLVRKQGRWLIYDVLVDGVGLVDGYHAEFGRLIRSEGPAELIDRMQRKLEVSGRY
jgi:phospholipid transport system substrate-binding protein